MPHTISGKTRVSRPDSRPNAKRRKKERAAAMEAADVKDLRATRIPKSKQKERRATGELRREVLPPEAKRARYLQKLLRQIEALKDRKDAGENLDMAQLQKLGRMDEVVSELEEIYGVDLGSSDEEEDGDDHEPKQEEDDEENSAKEDEEEGDQKLEQRRTKDRKKKKKSHKR